MRREIVVSGGLYLDDGQPLVPVVADPHSALHILQRAPDVAMFAA